MSWARRSGSCTTIPPTHGPCRTGWRLALAADLLAGSDATLGSIAAQVGYGNAFTLSTAFKRVPGLSPAEYRRSAASTA